MPNSLAYTLFSVSSMSNIEVAKIGDSAAWPASFLYLLAPLCSWETAEGSHESSHSG